jgi:geranylgeranylglycerol-phosphate geranylgeranyltransferase
MFKLYSYINIIRLPNAIMAGAAVLLGFWLSNSPFSPQALFFLVIAAVCSTGFGNVINDIKDLQTDRISHPQRPLPKNEISSKSAIIYALFLAFSAILFSFSVTAVHGIATLFPLVILTAYTLFLKGTPLAGNLTVASLVAYPVIYGSLGSPHFQKLIIPSCLAFLLNLSREIVKDLQDEKGDIAAGYSTSAILPKKFLKSLLLISSLFYLILLYLPFRLHHFGIVYAVICTVAIIPLHGYRSKLIIGKSWLTNVGKISTLYKIEMLSGLISLAADQVFYSIMK